MTRKIKKMSLKIKFIRLLQSDIFFDISFALVTILSFLLLIYNVE